MAWLQSRLVEMGRLVVDTVLPPTDDTDIFDTLTFLDDPCCASCGYPFDHQMSGISAFDLQCARCLARRPAYATARAALQYDAASRKLVLAFKHGGHTDRLHTFAAQMHRAGRTALAHADYIMPVPLHRTRLMKRRFNQSALLARALSTRCGVPMDAHSLLRAKRTPSQGGLSAKGRYRNVQGAFIVQNPEQIIGKRLVLIDDVMTTGATLGACARTLKRAGAARVDAICLARVVKPLATP
ncbi:phosphoribosyltransferase [Algimonas arctica]|uniref:Phosphoribosyltransferase n=1 Tax=Algimonas arctica TaxID=1479486 RepID=A0A8J3CSK2_9PROT|nr:ComF family protein [Algimonas arctica]GHB00581.1 phosphoribosyltransferase [Algimonas arctica]